MEQIKPLSIIEVCEMRRQDVIMAFDGATNGSREKGWQPGIGVFFKGQLIMEQMPEKYLNNYIDADRGYTKKYAIAHFEMLAIIVGLNHFRHQLKKRNVILLRTDNKQVEAALINKYSNDLFLADGVRWICMFAWKTETRFYVKYIHTKVNKIPDALSRYDRAKAQSLTEDETPFDPIWCREVTFPNFNIW